MKWLLLVPMALMFASCSYLPSYLQFTEHKTKDGYEIDIENKRKAQAAPIPDHLVAPQYYSNVILL